MQPISEVRQVLLRDYFPQIADLRNQVHVTAWSDHHLISQPLLDLLPFGQVFSPTSFYQYTDFQFPNLVENACRNLLYWSLSGARGFDNNPATQITLFFDETFFWHYYVPAKAQEIKREPSERT